MRIATWNIAHRRGIWDRVPALDADVVLLQEAPDPPPGLEGYVVHERFDPPRGWGTAIWSRSLPLRRLSVATSRIHPPSRPGAAAAAELTIAGGALLTLLSLHAVDDRIALAIDGSERLEGYAVTTMHRLLSDLTGYLDDRRRRGGRGHARNVTVLGGDFNCNPGWDGRTGTPSHRLVLDRVEAFGFHSVLPVRTDDRYATCVRKGRPVPFPQIDYIYVSDNAEGASGRLLDSPELRSASDHLPIVTELTV